MKVENGNLLSSWKDIAAYLKCAVRSCIRWEKELGLPVHRMTDVRGRRVYAYKEELDEWLKSKAVRQELERTPGPGKRSRRIILISLPVLAAVLLGVFLLIPRQKGPEPFDIGRFSIVTSEPMSPGRLRIWEATKSGAYKTTRDFRL